MKVSTEYTKKRILVTLDMTYIDSVLINYLVFLKEKFDIEHLVFFHNIWFNNAENGADILSKLDKPLVDILEDKIKGEVKEYFSESEYSIIVTESNNSAKEIKNIQKVENIDLTVFGKKTSVDDSGLIIERVLYNNSLSDILVVPENAFHQLENILVPVEFTKKSANTLIKSKALSEKIHASLYCLHVFSISNVYFPYLPIKDLKEQTLKKAKSEWEKHKKKYLESIEIPEIAFHFHANMSVSRSIYEYAIKEKTDIISIPEETSIMNTTLFQLLKMNMHLPILIMK
ncbi:hypothetical protein [Chondrinema litorale]|uniref:hypothetical protein n=1 Tax=Chondrinema litorale TaxID=2994555 RepID=UPI0025435AEF|nr:hypothetical protein [Chondrinema litorale]UZR96353.1 hypothetical protein OQ292_22095 [Chondrinema litorale]